MSATTVHPCTYRTAPDGACRSIVRAFCHQCQRDTATVLLPLSSGHVGRCCAVCRTLRRGHPYASKREYFNTSANTLTGTRRPCTSSPS